MPLTEPLLFFHVVGFDRQLNCRGLGEGLPNRREGVLKRTKNLASWV